MIVEVFHGEANPAEARVYARVSTEGGETLAGVTIAGSLYGPHSRYARTLPARTQFHMLGPGETLLAEAVLPDPCFWTPEAPFTYDVKLELRRGSEVVQQEERLFGIRPLAVRGKDLFLANRRWVLRGVLCSSSQEARQRIDFSAWHDSGAALVTGWPIDEALCREATEAGVMIAALVHRKDEREVPPMLSQLARWPAIGIAVLEDWVDAAQLQAQRPRNLLLGQRVRMQQPLVVMPWADLLFFELSEQGAARPEDFAVYFRDAELPLIAARAGDSAELAAARAGCDALQRDLAPYADLAGYVTIPIPPDHWSRVG